MHTTLCLAVEHCCGVYCPAAGMCLYAPPAQAACCVWTECMATQMNTATVSFLKCTRQHTGSAAQYNHTLVCCACVAVRSSQLLRVTPGPMLMPGSVDGQSCKSNGCHGDAHQATCWQSPSTYGLQSSQISMSISFGRSGHVQNTNIDVCVACNCAEKLTGGHLGNLLLCGFHGPKVWLWDQGAGYHMCR